MRLDRGLVIHFDIKGGGKGVEGAVDSSSEINRQGELLKKWIEQSGDEKLHLVDQSMSALVNSNVNLRA